MSIVSPVESFFESGSGGLTDRFHSDAKGEIPPRPLARTGAKVPLLGVGSFILHEFANQYAYRDVRELASKYNLLHNYGRVAEVKSYADGSEAILYETLHAVDGDGRGVMVTAQCPNNDKSIVVGSAEGCAKFWERRRAILSSLQTLRSAMVFHVVDNIWGPCPHTAKAPLDVTLTDPVMTETIRLVQCASCGLVLLADLSMPRYDVRPHVAIESHDAWRADGATPPLDLVKEPMSRRRWVHAVEIQALVALGRITGRDADVLRFRYELQPYSWAMAWDNAIRSNPKVALWK